MKSGGLHPDQGIGGLTALSSNPTTNTTNRVGVNKFKNEPRWRLGSKTMENEITLEMLGVIFSSDGHSNPHVNSRIMKCRRSLYRLIGCGMSFPGFNVDIKKYIWDSVCVSTLKYGLETMYLSNTQIRKLESLLGTLWKSSLGLSIHSHHSKFIRALNAAPVGEIIKMWFMEQNFYGRLSDERSMFTFHGQIHCL